MRFWWGFIFKYVFVLVWPDSVTYLDQGHRPPPSTQPAGGGSLHEWATWVHLPVVPLPAGRAVGSKGVCGGGWVEIRPIWSPAAWMALGRKLKTSPVLSTLYNVHTFVLCWTSQQPETHSGFGYNPRFSQKGKMIWQKTARSKCIKCEKLMNIKQISS